VSYAETAEPIEMPFGMWIPRVEGSMCYECAHWRHLEAGEYDLTVHVRLFCQVTLTTCYYYEAYRTRCDMVDIAFESRTRSV